MGINVDGSGGRCAAPIYVETPGKAQRAASAGDEKVVRGDALSRRDSRNCACLFGIDARGDVDASGIDVAAFDGDERSVLVRRNREDACLDRYALHALPQREQVQLGSCEIRKCELIFEGGDSEHVS